MRRRVKPFIGFWLSYVVFVSSFMFSGDLYNIWYVSCVASTLCHHHHSCPSRSDDDVCDASGVIADQTLMRKCVLTLDRLQQQPSALFWLGV